MTQLVFVCDTEKLDAPKGHHKIAQGKAKSAPKRMQRRPGAINNNKDHSPEGA